MRLINTHSRALEEFQNIDGLHYAILSHTWGKDEVTFADYSKADSFTKQGYLKIDHACKQAQHDGFDYVWVDTCCIDKSSSAELTEAINSMFAWYRKAQICYAYLEDVLEGFRASLQHPDEISGFLGFRRSRWFRRGYTLQELLAPENVEFYSKEWICIGSKATLVEQISQITNIGADLLLCKRPLSSASIAQRMSWVADRQTTKKEDLAYCLLGIFDVNLPLLYGEGDKAFIRLQEEILRNSDDQSIFAWVDDSKQPPEYCGLLARHPCLFKGSGDIISYRDWNLDPVPTNITNLGVSVSLPLTVSPDRIQICTARLCCRRGSKDISIELKCLAPVGQQFARISANKSLTPLATELARDERVYNHMRVYVRQNPLQPEPSDIRPRKELLECLGVRVTDSSGNYSGHFDMASNKITTWSDNPGSGALLWPHPTKRLGFSKNSQHDQEVHFLKVNAPPSIVLTIVFELIDFVHDGTYSYKAVAASLEHLTKPPSSYGAIPQNQGRWTMRDWEKACRNWGAWDAQIGDLQYNGQTGRQTFWITLRPRLIHKNQSSQAVTRKTDVKERTGWSFLAPLRSKPSRGKIQTAEVLQEQSRREDKIVSSTWSSMSDDQQSSISRY